MPEQREGTEAPGPRIRRLRQRILQPKGVRAMVKAVVVGLVEVKMKTEWIPSPDSAAW